MNTTQPELAKGKASISVVSVTIALVMVYLFWGGTYLGMKIAIESMPPFLMAGSRFMSAGLIMYMLSRGKGAPRPGAVEWRNSAIVGGLLLLMGNGGVAWAEQHVPSAIASLLVATVPLWMILLGRLRGSNKLQGPFVYMGILLGLAGIAVLVLHTGESAHTRLNPIGIIVLIIASISWAAGSLFSRSAQLPSSPLMSTAVQMLAGGALLLILSFIREDWSGVQLAEISVRSWAAFGYLVIFGSLLGYTAYIWLLNNADPAVASTYAFVNPVVAVFLGFFAGNEALTINVWIATLMIVAAVVFITRGKEKRK
ncbi:drug/metabolite exporter YedA [Paenibacillus sp. HN-1]|uniref:drug/metabolite exporter YedA n=1 Tax=Paenibacillus TaxID=44249 RepID=UPI001CA7D36B|nr:MULTISPECIES: drug/metabolite exporter YedA [Paenibacillus]MBY9078078.1 drug/metabolite exporter YedA [Paenibacillus sp. CGMCC 1.18879]MBY9083819.1 drug/metabolite exporter YedA [Paenibacillus sinensis]